MNFTLRLVGAIWITAMIVIAGFAFFSVQAERSRLRDDLHRRAALLGDGLREAVEPLMEKPSVPRLERIVKKFSTPTRGIAVYDRFAGPLVVTPDLAPILPQTLPFISEAATTATAQNGFEQIGERNTYYYAVPLMGESHVLGVLAVFYDARYIDTRVSEIVNNNAIRFLVLASALSLIILVIVRWSITHPLTRMAEWAKQLRSGGNVPPLGVEAAGSLFGPLANEVTGLAKKLVKAQAAAEQEALLRLQGESLWTEERVKQFVALRLNDRPLFLVSNREPLSHVWRGRQIEAQTPASGLVTALDPVMRACGGVWVAHGSGDADREMVDSRGTLRVPPENPRYTLKRVWLTKDEEEGYYYGFANEGLWPLCHIVHARPTFRPEDWGRYAEVNQKFADAVLEEMAGSEASVVLIQDYHFALLPRMIKNKRPDARIAIFWHIPWPNPEAFGICPWQPDILWGMLGADLIGFHTQFHCNNFLETVERAIEARIDWEHFSVIRGHHATYVKPFPISVAPQFVDDPPKISRQALLSSLRISPEFLGVGVDRIDYTKGLPERFRAIRRFFERCPQYRGRMVFVQLAAPSRTRIPRYRELEEEVERTVESINQEFQTRSWTPILFLKAHHNHREIWPFYRWADFCMVTSLHDGMNLVAKEFVSVREDEEGVLILSRFTGAARELQDALLVNPYDIDKMAEAIREAIEMPQSERQIRMARMRRVVRDDNIYRWAGQLLSELARLPVEDLGARER
jgi:trehalose 6-phosphate synthase